VKLSHEIGALPATHIDGNAEAKQSEQRYKDDLLVNRRLLAFRNLTTAAAGSGLRSVLPAGLGHL
jgi:hypothetical protein